jgi:hypothetical protein
MLDSVIDTFWNAVHAIFELIDAAIGPTVLFSFGFAFSYCCDTEGGATLVSFVMAFLAAFPILLAVYSLLLGIMFLLFDF